MPLQRHSGASITADDYHDLHPVSVSVPPATSRVPPSARDRTPRADGAMADTKFCTVCGASPNTHLPVADARAHHRRRHRHRPTSQSVGGALPACVAPCRGGDRYSPGGGQAGAQANSRHSASENEGPVREQSDKIRAGAGARRAPVCQGLTLASRLQSPLPRVRVEAAVRGVHRDVAQVQHPALPNCRRNAAKTLVLEHHYRGHFIILTHRRHQHHHEQQQQQQC